MLAIKTGIANRANEHGVALSFGHFSETLRIDADSAIVDGLVGRLDLAAGAEDHGKKAQCNTHDEFSDWPLA